VPFWFSRDTPEIPTHAKVQLRQLESRGTCSVDYSNPRGCRITFHLKTVLRIGRWGVPEYLVNPKAILNVSGFPSKAPTLVFVDEIPFHPFVRARWRGRGRWIDPGGGFPASVDLFLQDVSTLLRFEGIRTDGQDWRCANPMAMEWYSAWDAMTRGRGGHQWQEVGAAPDRGHSPDAGKEAVKTVVPDRASHYLRSGRMVAVVVSPTVIGLTHVGQPIRKGPIKLVVKTRGRAAPSCHVSRLSPEPFNPHFSRSRFCRLVRARWIDPSPTAQVTRLDPLLDRIALALSMTPSGLDLKSGRIANETATAWCRFWQENAGTAAFPIPSTAEGRREERKKFTIMQKPAEKAMSPDPTRDRKFRIDSTDEGYRPESRVASVGNSLVHSESAAGGKMPSGAVLYVKDTAMRRIHEHIEWKRRSAANLVEQGGILLGSATCDPKTGFMHGLVTQAVPARVGARGSGAHLELGHEAWHAMLQEVDVMRDEETTRLHVIGWYHTHPGELDVFMSSVDRHTQEQLFSEDWQFAIVLNPQRCTWRAFNGRASQECRGVWLAPAPF